MFSFFKKFKQVSDADGDGKGDKAGASPAAPARRRDDKGKDKGINREQEVGSSSYDTKRTDLAPSTGAKRKDTERKSGEVKEQQSVHQRGKKNESVTVKAEEKKVSVQETCTAKVMGGVTAAMTCSDDTDDIGKNGDLAKSEATHTKREASQDKERTQHEAEGALAAGSQRNVLMSRSTPVDPTMGIKTQEEERPTEDNEVTQKVSEFALSSGSQGKFTALENLMVKKQVEHLENEK
jgi:hypothetical protein